jgi:translation elongation factor EF-1alpha
MRKEGGVTTGERVGKVTNFYNKISVAVLQLEQDLQLGDVVHFLGAHTDFRQEITSMQIEHEPVTAGEAGEEVAVKVRQRVRGGDSVYLLLEEE